MPIVMRCTRRRGMPTRAPTVHFFPFRPLLSLPKMEVAYRKPYGVSACTLYSFLFYLGRIYIKPNGGHGHAYA